MSKFVTVYRTVTRLKQLIERKENKTLKRKHSESFPPTLLPLLPPTVMPGSRMETDRPATSLCRVN